MSNKPLDHLKKALSPRVSANTPRRDQPPILSNPPIVKTEALPTEGNIGAPGPSAASQAMDSTISDRTGSFSGLSPDPGESSIIGADVVPPNLSGSPTVIAETPVGPTNMGLSGPHSATVKRGPDIHPKTGATSGFNVPVYYTGDPHFSGAARHSGFDRRDLIDRQELRSQLQGVDSTNVHTIADHGELAMQIKALTREVKKMKKRRISSRSSSRSSISHSRRARSSASRTRKMKPTSKHRCSSEEKSTSEDNKKRHRDNQRAQFISPTSMRTANRKCDNVFTSDSELSVIPCRLSSPSRKCTDRPLSTHNTASVAFRPNNYTNDAHPSATSLAASNINNIPAPVSNLKKPSFSANELNNPSFSANELNNPRFSANELNNHSFAANNNYFSAGASLPFPRITLDSLTIPVHNISDAFTHLDMLCGKLGFHDENEKFLFAFSKFPDGWRTAFLNSGVPHTYDDLKNFLFQLRPQTNILFTNMEIPPRNRKAFQNTVERIWQASHSPPSDFAKFLLILNLPSQQRDRMRPHLYKSWTKFLRIANDVYEESYNFSSHTREGPFTSHQVSYDNRRGDYRKSFSPNAENTKSTPSTPAEKAHEVKTTIPAGTCFYHGKYKDKARFCHGPPCPLYTKDSILKAKNDK